MEDIIKEHIEKEIKKRTLHIRLYEESIQKSTNEEYIRPSLVLYWQENSTRGN
jgi:hypothetical protein